MASTQISGASEDRLVAFESLVRKWNPAVNLVSKSSLADLRHRHIADSIQLLAFSEVTGGHWVDLGTGGGFPGLVIAILAAEIPGLRVTCIESDGRKAAFLTAAVRELGVDATVLAQRIEDAAPQQGDVVSARALAPLDLLLPLALRHLKPGGMAIFPKGARYATEVAAARGAWRFDLTEAPSLTDPGARLLKLEGLARA